MGVNEIDLSNIHLLENIFQIFIIHYDQRNHMLYGDTIQGEGNTVQILTILVIFHVFAFIFENRTVFLVKSMVTLLKQN